MSPCSLSSLTPGRSDRAEVTAGGLALHEVSPDTMEVRRHAGLYAFGELLDLDGPIGGLNFQAAFATAELAGRHAGASKPGVRARDRETR